MKRLIIYVPSYNRPEKLKAQLEALSRSRSRGAFDVVVNDNASSRDYGPVQELCRAEGYDYRRRVANIGANPNIVDGFMFSDRGEYLWILSDDDPVKDGAVDTVLSLLEGSPDVLYLTHEQRSREAAAWGFREFMEQAVYHSDGAGLISNVVYRTEAIRDSIEAGYEAVFSCFPHLAVQFDLFQRRAAVRVVRIGSGVAFAPRDKPDGLRSDLKDQIPLAYQRSYFGYLFLAWQIRDLETRREFVNRWASFWNLRHWYRNAQSGGRDQCAAALVEANAYWHNLFRMKRAIWRLYPQALRMIGALPMPVCGRVRRTTNIFLGGH